MPSIVNLSSISRSEYDRLKKTFSCKDRDLDEHIKKYAFSHQKDGLFNTYFLVDDDGTYLSYISVAIATIEIEDKKGILGISNAIKYPIPTLKITRFCTFDGLCRKGAGSILMAFVQILAVVQQMKIGCRAVIVDSKKEAVSFYKDKFNFVVIEQEENSDTISMIYPLLKPSENRVLIPDMIDFCEKYGQEDLKHFLTHL